MQRIKKGDDVIVIAGRDKGKRGNVLRVNPDGRALVDNVNLVKRHTRGNPNTGETGGIIEKEAPIQLSNLAIYNPVTKKGDRVGFKTLEDGRKVRYFKSNNEVVDLG
jgi:large subunit ribosomal protein L24